jgi:hypothetical protein
MRVFGAHRKRRSSRDGELRRASDRYFEVAQQSAPTSQQLLPCFFTTFLAVVAQQVFASAQHALPSAQHDPAKQQSSPVRQHGAPTRQQSGTQQSAPSAQQFKPKEQQSALVVAELLLGVAAPDPANTTPIDRITAVRMFFNMECLQ